MAVSDPDAKLKNGSAFQSTVPGCSQLSDWNTMALPSVTWVWVACLCAWVDIEKNLAPAGTAQVPPAVPVDIAGMLICVL